MNFSVTRRIIINWRSANNDKMRAEFVKQHNVGTYDEINSERDPERKKEMIDGYVNQNRSEYKAWGGLKNENIEEFKNMFLNDMDHKYNSWRRKLSPFSLLLNSAYLKFAEVLIEKLGKKVKLNNSNIIINSSKIQTRVAAGTKNLRVRVSGIGLERFHFGSRVSG
ncbi:unnamed protein product [Meloidogyne enterolobii]|uniref:Uncharacterized protein n=1 Tax=Meloidogyne enterolobii TaxID=390850 RepID=A0ACB1A8G6_MELEN